jgi:DNA replication protein DnaC
MRISRSKLAYEKKFRWTDTPKELDTEVFEYAELPYHLWPYDDEINHGISAKHITDCQGKNVLAEFAKNLKQNFIDGNGLYIHGKADVKKSLAAAVICHKALFHGASVLFADTKELFSLIVNKKMSDQEHGLSWFERAVTCNLLVLDDARFIMMNRDLYECMYSIIHTRKDYCNSTIITSKATKEALAKDYAMDVSEFSKFIDVELTR